MSLKSILDVLAPLPLPPVDDAWNETPLSTRKQVGRLVNRTVAWLPANLAIIGLVAAILCTSKTDSSKNSLDSSLGDVIGPPIAAIVLAIINTINERRTARKIVLYNQTIEEAYSALREKDSLPIHGWKISASKMQELQTQLSTETTQDRVAFTQECELLFNEKHLIGSLFHYWNNRQLKDIFFERHKAISNRLQSSVDVACSPLFSTPLTSLTFLLELLLVTGIIAISTYMMAKNDDDRFVIHSDTLKEICRANMALSVWILIPTFVRRRLILNLVENYSTLLASVREIVHLRQIHNSRWEPAYLSWDPSIFANSDSEGSLERKDEIKIDILET